MLSLSELVLVSIVVGALALIVSGKLRADVVALLVLLTLTAVGLVTLDEALSGFSRTVIFIILGLFIISEALENTGVMQRLANRLRQLGRGSEIRLMLIFMTVGAGLSVIMSTVAAAAVLLPAAVQVGRDSGVRPSKLLIPLAFGTLVGGMATLFTTANIIVSGILVDQRQPPLTMTSFLPTGGLIVLMALLYMSLIGRRLLPDRDSVGQTINPALLSRNLYETYQLEERLWEVRIPPTCQLVNTALSHSRIGEELGITVLAIWRGQQAILTPEPIEVINPGDFLLVLGREDRVMRLSDWGVVVGRENGHTRHRHDYAVDMTEVIIPPRSKAIGRSLQDLRFRNKFGLTSVAVWREGRSARTDVGKLPLQVGDALLMVGPARKIKALAQERDFLVLQSSHLYQPPAPHKALAALVITVLTLAAAITGILPTAEAVLIGALAAVLVGCLTMDEAYRAVDWRVIFLIAGMLPISVAMVKTGLAGQMGDLLVNTLAPHGTLALLAGIYLLTMLISQVIGGQVAALVIGPVAIAAALRIGVNPQAVGVTVAIACSSAFLTPIAHSVNVLMMGPGGYKFGDFFRVGLGMMIVTFVTLLAGLMLFWGIR